MVLKASVARQADCTLCEPPWIKAQEGGGKDSSQKHRASLHGLKEGTFLPALVSLFVRN